MKRITVILAAMLLLPMVIFGQTYDKLWKEVASAQDKDLPQTAMTSLQKLQRKAASERHYGQLLKSTLRYARLQAEVAPDSLLPAVERLQREEQAATDPVLQAVYDAVLSVVWASNRQLGDDYEQRAADYRQRALAHPDVLARVKDAAYAPFVQVADGSEVFGHDLLSVVGMELSAWKWMSDYYARSGNRRAACLMALAAVKEHRGKATSRHLSSNEYIRRLDSLTQVYGDLQEAGAIAIERYAYMDSETEATPAEKAAYLRQALSRWGSWSQANQLRNDEKMLTSPLFEAELDRRLLMPGEAQTLRLPRLRNLQQVTMAVYRTGLKGDTKLNPAIKKDYDLIKKDLTELPDHRLTLACGGHADYEVTADSMVMEGLPAGIYLLEFKSMPETSVVRRLCYVSGVRSVMQAQPDGNMRIVVVDARSGQPIPGAKVRVTSRKRWNGPEESRELTCDKQGEVRYAGDDRMAEFFVRTDDDQSCPVANQYGRYTFHERDYDRETVSLFTDRSIYRPGQKVHVAAILWKELSAMAQTAVSGRTLHFVLRDANGKVVSEQQAVTDDYGKCAATFTLPTGTLNGLYTIRANQQRMVSFRVEEYKRPTFQVVFEPYNNIYKDGDTLRVSAKAASYAGVPVQGARVRYTVKRRVAYWWLNYSWYWNQGYVGKALSDELLYEGEAVTDDDGRFEALTPIVMPKDLGHRTMYYHFVVEADVTDMGGESHHATKSLPLGTKATTLTCDLPQKVRGDELPAVTFHRYNAAGGTVDGTVRYRLDGGPWKEVAANSAQPVFKGSLKSGEHRLEAQCEGDTMDMQFVVFGLDDKHPATTTDDWFYVSDNVFPGDGKAVTVQVGSSDADLHIVYALYAGNQQVEGGVLKESRSLWNRKFTYDEKYGNGLLLTFAWVKDGKCHKHEQFIHRPMPDKRLRLTWETFRDRLYPGQEETWRLKVAMPDGRPADASVMAVLYDQSLDALYQHGWGLSTVPYLPQPSTSWLWTDWGGLTVKGVQQVSSLTVPMLSYSRFDRNDYPTYRYPHMVMATRVRGSAKTNSAIALASAPTDDMEMMSKSAAADEARIGAMDVAGDEAAEEPAKTEDQVRENLQETAFFYPMLRTDEQGGVTLTFTLPESLTTWRFMGLANSRDMLHGSLEGTTVAQKQLMVQPNMPRFVREGDEAVVTTRIINMGEQPLSGHAYLRLTDAAGDGELLSLTQPIEVEGGKTVSVSFRIPASVLKPSLLVCKVSALATTADHDGYSDGEQHYLPVLSDKEYVTKTVPYTQHEPGVKTIDLGSLFPQGTTQQKLTVEYTNNPAWLMVQSLATVGTPWEHSAIDQAAAYYSNLLAKQLADQTPQLRTVFAQWQRESAKDGSLVSALNKNQELKDLLLAETPWVMAADREHEQKQRLADFFDDNTLTNRLTMAVEKLTKLQNGDGSFSWYPGMSGSLHITVSVAEMLSRLHLMTGSEGVTASLFGKAFDYLGREMVTLTTEMKRQERKGIKQTFPSMAALQWLYICALDGRPLSTDVQRAHAYLMGLLKKDIKRQSIYEKAMTAVILAKHGEGKLARQYVQSLKEYTVYSEELGRYYDTPKAGYSWYDYKIPTEVAAIEAIHTVTPDDQQTLDEMRRWLLQEKRTQAWGTPINSINAIYAFLCDSKGLLAPREQTVLAIDGKPMALPQATAGIGYVKTAIEAPQGRQLTATKTSEGTSWGAVYAQFLQKTSEVEAQQSGLSVKREVLMNGRPQTTLKVGDRVKVRITIVCSRDLDFVQVADRRAACMEPVGQLSGYRNGAYCSPKDCSTNYYFYGLSKGKHVIETDYYIDRAGTYESGTCSAQCAYAAEYRAVAPSMTLNIK